MTIEKKKLKFNNYFKSIIDAGAHANTEKHLRNRWDANRAVEPQTLHLYYICMHFNCNLHIGWRDRLTEEGRPGQNITFSSTINHLDSIWFKESTFWTLWTRTQQHKIQQYFGFCQRVEASRVIPRNWFGGRTTFWQTQRWVARGI